MKYISTLLCFIFFCSCVQQLIDKPDNLISEEKITHILYDMAILNAAKSTNVTILKDQGIDPMEFLFLKYKIDSTQFVESNRYYASLPDKYEKIYTTVNTRLKDEGKRVKSAKKMIDSLKIDSLKIEEQKNIHKEAKGLTPSK